MASTMVGGASLISFPVLLGLGIPPLIANVTNTSGLVPTAIGAALASQPELRGQRSQLTFLAVPAVLGSLSGVALLLAFPAETFERDRKSTRLNSSHANISYAVFCLKKKTQYRVKNN